jgi:hypothetical protein
LHRDIVTGAVRALVLKTWPGLGRAWVMYPVFVTLGAMAWSTKLMTKKGGDFFVALKASVRRKEGVTCGDTVTLVIRFL